MCGIFGYKGKENCKGKIIDGLKALEYRGYDSWGIAVKEDKKIIVEKHVGKISDAKKQKPSNSRIGIGHTRWATHGKVTKKNSHPHHDSSGRFYVVHNGIIENYEALKKKIKDKRFYSETDSEIIPKLIYEYKNLGFVKSVQKIVKMLEGNFAFVAIDKESDVIIAARNGSPLVIGVKKDETYIASDIPSFLPYTKEIIFMDDKDLVVIDDKVKFYNFNGKEIKKQIKKTDLDVEKAMKGKYEHFMLKEIYEQPKVVKETVDSYLKNGKLRFNEYLNGNAIKNIDKIKKIIIIACGTSWHAGLVSEYWFESFSKISVEVEYASEFRYRDPLIEKGTVVIAISQSGETADTIAAIKEAKGRGAKVISLCNVVGSTIDRISDIGLYTRAGPEIGVASTKAFTTQLSVLLLLSLFFASVKKTLTKGAIAKKLREIEKMPDMMEEVLKEQKDVLKIVKKHYSKNNSLFLGRGVNYPIALEGALKLKEISYIHAEGYPAAEMKHGPIALIDKEMPSVFICVKDDSYEKVISNIQEVRARKGVVIAVATKKDEKIKKLADHVVYIPNTLGSLTPFLSVLPLQMMAYLIAKKRNCEIDKPRNLAKSVTVE